MRANRIILTLGMTLIVVYSFAGKPPVPVQKTFDQMFPGATGVKWTKETPITWEASFVFNGIICSADFSTQGAWLETEFEIKQSELPQAASTSLAAEFVDWIVTVVYKIESADGDPIYSVDLTKGVIRRVIAFKEDGSPVPILEGR